MFIESFVEVSWWCECAKEIDKKKFATPVFTRRKGLVKVMGLFLSPPGKKITFTCS